MNELGVIFDNIYPEITLHVGLIEFVKNRPEHDRRYAIDAKKIQRESGWTPADSFERNIQFTMSRYLGNQVWWEAVRSGIYREYLATHYSISANER